MVEFRSFSAKVENVVIPKNMKSLVLDSYNDNTIQRITFCTSTQKWLSVLLQMV